jgi:hypothetical protein
VGVEHRFPRPLVDSGIGLGRGFGAVARLLEFDNSFPAWCAGLPNRLVGLLIELAYCGACIRLWLRVYEWIDDHDRFCRPPPRGCW